jgi:autotransporter-associated beta strand protein
MSRKNANHQNTNQKVMLAAAAAAVIWFGQPSHSAVVTWDNDPGTAGAQDGGGNWDLATLNWFNGANVSWNNANNDVAVFGAGGTGGAVTVAQDTVIGGLTFGVDGYTLSGGTFTISGATPINITAGIATLSTPIAGAGSVSYSVAGTSTISLGIASTYTGGTSFSGGGTVDLTTSGIAGLGTGSVTLGGINLRFGAAGTGRQYNFLAGTTNRISINGNGTFNGDTLVTTGDGTVILENLGADPNDVITMEGNNEAFTGTFQVSTATLRFRRTTADSANAVWDLGTSGTTGTGFIGGNQTLQLGAVMGEAGSFMDANIRGADAGGTLTYEVGAKNIDTTYNGVIRDSNTTDKFTAIRKVGTGRWTLGGANSYTGITEVNAGTLALSSTGTLAVDIGFGILSGSQTVLVNTGGNFDVSAHVPYNVPSVQTIAGSGGTIHGDVNLGAGRISPAGASAAGTTTFNDDLTLSGGLVNLNFMTPNVVGNAENDLISIGGDLNLSSGTFLVSPLGAMTAGADYPLIQYTGSLIGALTNVSVAPAARANVQLNHDAVSKTISLHVNSVSAPASLVWNGSGDIWDVAISQNWLNGATADRFFQDDSVTFNDTGGVPTTVNLVGNLFPTSVTINSTNNNYTFTGTGVIGGDSSVTKSGDSTWTLSQTASNNYTGGTTINGGTVVLQTTQATLGTGSIVMNNNTTLQFNGSRNNPLNVNGTVNLVWADNTNDTYSGALSGSGTLNLFALGGGSLINYNGAMADFTGTLNLSNITGGQFRLNSGGDNNAIGGPNIILDLGSAPVTFSNRNGTTITFGAVIGGSGPILSGSQTGTGVTTYSIGASNINSTFGGIIQNGGGATNIIKVGTGVLTLTGSNTYTGNTTVTAGSLVLSGTGAQAPVLANTNPDAFADVQGGRLVLDYTGGTSPASQVLGVLDAGFDQTPKFSAGIIRSTTADATTGLGWVDDGAKVIIARTYFGDADLNGQVDVADLGILASNWQTAANWGGADFDYSGFVDVADLGMLASNWQAGVGSPLGPSLQEAIAAVGLGNVAVPEPASMGLIGVLASWALKRRSRRSSRA